DADLGRSPALFFAFGNLRIDTRWWQGILGPQFEQPPRNGASDVSDQWLLNKSRTLMTTQSPYNRFARCIKPL
ncbi:hypothetical protein BZG21_27630, partial [Escherichia coli]|nr:hypothetical protein [Escherichia coli]